MSALLAMSAKFFMPIMAWGLLFAPGEPPPEVGPPRSASAVRTEVAMTIDGLADETVWAAAPVAGGFQERSPDLGAEPPYETRFRVAYDENNLYVFVELDMPRDQIRVRTLQRDSFNIFSDSAIGLKIDPHHDRRSAMTFAVNADGTQLDWMVLEDGRVDVPAWDAVWEAETHYRDDGWDAEFRIPFYVMGIKGGDSFTMGFQLTRDEPTLNATYDWRLMIPPRHPVSASAFGELDGFENVEAQRALEFTPYVVANTDFQPVFRLDPRRRANLGVGGDMRVQVGTGSYVEASVLTDFAQVEADQVQVRDDRFPLFFPERRPFFINGLDVFNFGLPGQAQLFFSRRIGLEDGIPAPIAGGVKAYGRSGPISYGVLNVQTLRQLPHDKDDEIGEGASPENFTVGRFRVQTGKYASVGILGVGRHRFEQEGYDAFSGGVDAEVRALDGKLRTYGFLASTWRETPDTPPTVDDEGRVSERGEAGESELGGSASVLVEYQGLYTRPYARWLRSDERFQAPLGFYRRPGTAEQAIGVVMAPRPRVFGLREIQFGPELSVTTDPQYEQLLTRFFANFISFNWNRGWRLLYGMAQFSDEVQNSFELYGYEVEAGRYEGLNHEVNFSTPGREAVSGGVGYTYSQPFGGERHGFNLSLTARAGKHFSVSGSYSHYLGHLADPKDTYNFGFLNGTVLAAIHRNLTWDNLVRFSAEPGQERFGLQSRIRWRYRPGSDLFLVYRTDLPLSLAPPGEPPREPFHSLTLKLTIYLRALLRG